MYVKCDDRRLKGRWVAVVMAMGLWAVGVFASPLQLVDGVYRADKAFPEYMPLWREGWKWTDSSGQRMQYAREGMPLGGYLQVYVHNRGNDPVEITDVLLNGASLRDGVAPENDEKVRKGKYASNLQFSKLPKTQIGRLTAAGEPVWWKVDPLPIPAGGMGEVTVRLRREPRVPELSLTVVSDGGELASRVRVAGPSPRVSSISFSDEMDEAFLYVCGSGGDASAPAKVFFDGKDVTGTTSIPSGGTLPMLPVVVRLPEKVREPDFHLFQVRYTDGTTATASIRAWEPEFRYGMWGVPKEGDTPQERAKIYLQRLHDHNINTLMSHYGGEVRKFVQSDPGREFCRRIGMRVMDHSVGSIKDPIYFYLPDEPDAHDFACSSIPSPEKRLGSLAQWIIGLGREFRRDDPSTLQLCNVDNTYKPEQWYMYAQLPDVISADPYYPEQLRSVYRFDPGSLGAYTQPTYVYAVGEIYRSAGAPKPMHLILHSCRFDMEEFPFRAPTPEEKRVEVYYALASGAKGISYWWYTPSKGRYYGCGGRSPDMEALMSEIGLLGAEVRTAGPVISRSCPVAMAVEAPRQLWVRTLLSGQDTVVVLVVNDNMACDQAGVTIRPIEKARVNVELPGWLKSRDVFEVTHGGVHDVDWKGNEEGVRLELGTVEVTRMLVVTSDTKLRTRLQGLYEKAFASNVAAIVAPSGKAE